MDTAILTRLGEINPLKTISPGQLEQLLAQADVVDARRGDVVFREGDRDEDAVYLVSGTLRTESTSGGDRIIEAGSDSSNYALGNLKPRPFTAVVASEVAVIVRVDRSRVEKLSARSQMVTGEQPAVMVTDMGETQVDSAWMFQILQSALFRDLPTENLEQFFSAIERVELGA
jgi:CRP-like cAMP-binding protein